VAEKCTDKAMELRSSNLHKAVTPLFNPVIDKGLHPQQYFNTLMDSCGGHELGM
jgi:hypothetical protein